MNDSLLPVAERTHRNLNKGHHFEFKIPASQAQFTVLIGQALENPFRRPEHGYNWRGQKFGRIEVVAYSHASHWVIRCVCGNHEMRHGRTLQKRSPFAMCLECRRIAELRGDFLGRGR